MSGGTRQWMKRQIVSPSLKSSVNISYLDLHPRVWCWIINPLILFITPQTLTRCSAALESFFLSSSLRLSLLHVSDDDHLISKKVSRIFFIRIRMSVDAHVGGSHTGGKVCRISACLHGRRLVHLSASLPVSLFTGDSVDGGGCSASPPLELCFSYGNTL